ncbi:MAG: hypothetical protein QME81_15345, partial [bacterium]|nr:hypothetical protein [bacterium]
RHTIGSYHLPFQQSWSVGRGYLHSIIQDIERRDSLNAPLDTFSSNADGFVRQFRLGGVIGHQEGLKLNGN